MIGTQSNFFKGIKYAKIHHITIVIFRIIVIGRFYMEIGTAIKFYRKYQSLSQKDLAEGICSQGEISLIEKGDRIPSISMNSKICSKLGIAVDALEEENFYESHELHISKVLNKLELFVNNREYEKMEPLLNDEIMNKYCNNPLNTQCFLCYKGIFINYKENNPIKALEIFRSALQETNITSFSTIFDFPKHKNIFSKHETLLIAGAASCFYQLHKYEQASYLFDVACNNIDNIKYQLSTQILGTVYYNASRNLKELGEYELALKLALKGLTFEKERKTIYRSAELLFEIGEIYYLKNKPQLDETNYIKSLYLAFTTNSNYLLPILLATLKERKELTLLQTNIGMLMKIS